MIRWAAIAILVPGIGFAADPPFLTKFKPIFEEIGITIVYDRGTICSDPNVLAGYMAFPNRMVICDGNVLNQSEKNTVVKHETVHIIQDCKAGLVNYESEILFSPSQVRSMFYQLDENTRNITMSYAVYEQAIETEAYFLQNYSDDWFESQIRRWCFE